MIEEGPVFIRYERSRYRKTVTTLEVCEYLNFDLYELWASLTRAKIITNIDVKDLLSKIEYLQGG